MIAIFGQMAIAPFMQQISNICLNIALTTISSVLGKLKTQLYCYSIGALLKITLIFLSKQIWNS